MIPEFKEINFFYFSFIFNCFFCRKAKILDSDNTGETNAKVATLSTNFVLNTKNTWQKSGISAGEEAFCNCTKTT